MNEQSSKSGYTPLNKRSPERRATDRRDIGDIVSPWFLKYKAQSESFYDFAYNELKRETWLRKYRALLKGIHAKNDELRENFRSLSEYNKKNGGLTPAAYELGFDHPWGIVTASISAALESGAGYMVKIDNQGFIFFECFKGEDREHTECLLVAFIPNILKRGTAGKFYEAAVENGVDAGEAVAAFKKLFEGIYKMKA